jgi:hypothetical protein
MYVIAWPRRREVGRETENLEARNLDDSLVCSCATQAGRALVLAVAALSHSTTTGAAEWEWEWPSSGRPEFPSASHRAPLACKWPGVPLAWRSRNRFNPETHSDGVPLLGSESSSCRSGKGVERRLSI